MNEQDAKKRKRQRPPNNHTITEFRISNELWAMLQPLLPVHVNTLRFGGGQPCIIKETSMQCGCDMEW